MNDVYDYFRVEKLRKAQLQDDYEEGLKKDILRRHNEEYEKQFVKKEDYQKLYSQKVRLEAKVDKLEARLIEWSKMCVLNESGTCIYSPVERPFDIKKCPRLEMEP